MCTCYLVQHSAPQGLCERPPIFTQPPVLAQPSCPPQGGLAAGEPLGGEWAFRSPIIHERREAGSFSAESGSPRRLPGRMAEWKSRLQIGSAFPMPAGLPPASPIYIPQIGGSKSRDSVSQKNSRAQLAADGRHARACDLWRDRHL